MPAVKIFQELREKTNKNQGLLPAEKRAMFWFRDYATDLTRWQRRHVGTKFNELRNHEFTKELTSVVRPGFLYFYMYDPKWKKELPYYDLFPFTLVLHEREDSFLGLNFHYLDYYHRARFFDLLYPFREGRPARPQVRDIRMHLNVTYAILKYTSKYKAFKPCIKRYLKEHVQTPYMKVGAKEWDIALFLPVEMFVKKTKQQVWKLSEQKIK